jgi:hypothetical protein
MARQFERETALDDTILISTDGRRFRLRAPGLGCRGSVITLSAEAASGLMAYIKLVRVIDPEPEGHK